MSNILISYLVRGVSTRATPNSAMNEDGSIFSKYPREGLKDCFSRMFKALDMWSRVV